MTVVPFDFRVAPAGQSERRTTDWFSDASQIAPKKWARHWPVLHSLVPERVELKLPIDSLKALPGSAVGFTLQLHTEPPQFAFLAMDRPLFLTLLAGLLGEPVASLPEDRELTPIERSMAEYMIPLLLAPLCESWPNPDPLKLTVTAVGPPRTTCRLPARDHALWAAASVHGTFGGGLLILALAPFGPLAASADSEPGAKTPAFDRLKTENVLREMPVEFAVMLGQTRVGLRQLSHLKAGDILVLDQKINEPLPALVEGMDKFRVSPGASGKLQAVRIHSMAGMDEQRSPAWPKV